MLHAPYHNVETWGFQCTYTEKVCDVSSSLTFWNEKYVNIKKDSGSFNTAEGIDIICLSLVVEKCARHCRIFFEQSQSKHWPDAWWSKQRKHFRGGIWSQSKHFGRIICLEILSDVATKWISLQILVLNGLWSLVFQLFYDVAKQFRDTKYKGPLWTI